MGARKPTGRTRLGKLQRCDCGRAADWGRRFGGTGMTDLSIAAEVAPALLTETGEVGGGEVVLFWILAPIMVLAALGLIFVRRAVHAAFKIGRASCRVRV